jgi:hypothetical protein
MAAEALFLPAVSVTVQEQDALRAATDAFQKQFEITRVLLERAQRGTVIFR